MDELIDILDENELKTGEIETRKEVHKKGLYATGTDSLAGSKSLVNGEELIVKG